MYKEVYVREYIGLQRNVTYHEASILCIYSIA